VAALATVGGFERYEISNDQASTFSGDGPLYFYTPIVGSAGELVHIPLGSSEPGSIPAAVEIAVSTNPNTLFRTACAIRDPRTAPLIGYFTSGRLSDAAELVREMPELFERAAFPRYASLVAGYVMIATARLWDDELLLQRLSWLYEMHPGSPDVAILAGAYLQLPRPRKPPAAALACYQQAVDQGVPMFTAGVTWLQNGLASFPRLIDGAELDRAQIFKVALLATRCNPSQAFTSLRIHTPQP
jgi:hypothetical protein